MSQYVSDMGPSLLVVSVNILEVENATDATFWIYEIFNPIVHGAIDRKKIPNHFVTRIQFIQLVLLLNFMLSFRVEIIVYGLLFLHFHA